MPLWKKSFYAIWVAEFIAIAGFATSNPIIPLFISELGVHDLAALNLWTGLTSTGASLAMAFFAPIWGALADSYGRKLMLLRAMLGGAVLVGLMSLVQAPWQIMTLRTLQGMVTGTVAAATVLTASMVPVAEIGFRLGLMQMAVYMGNSLGPLLGGSIHYALGSRANFLITSLFLLVAAGIIWFLVKEDFQPKPRSNSFLRNAVPDFSPLVKTPGLLPLMAAIFAVQLANSVTGSMLTLFVRSLAGDSRSLGLLSGIIQAVGAFTGALAAGVLGKASGRIGYGKTLLICLSGAFLFYLPQGFATAPWQLIVLRAGSGFFLGGAMPSINALISTLCQKDKQGSTYGLSASISSGGMAAGPALGAVLATATGYPSVFFVTAGILGTTGLLVHLGIRRRNAGAAQQGSQNEAR
ncbi:MAG: MFS transporter [Spirochaetes bacterium]|nr:MFS transporter [Spirochaetota bacterium]